MWKENWLQFIDDLKGIPSNVDSSEIAPPISEEQIDEIEKKFCVALPPKFKDFLMNSAGGIDIWWGLEDDALVKLDGENEPISSGCFIISFEEILEGNEYLELDDNDLNEYDLEYHPKNLLAFASVPNGDQYAVVLSGPEADSIKYMSHDLDDIHLYTVGKDINSFLSHYARLGFAGCEYWIWEQFTNQKTTPIDSESSKAEEFLEAIKSGVRSPEAEELSKKAEIAAKIATQIALLKQKKDVEGLEKLFLEYKDTLSEEFKQKLEIVVKQALQDIESKDESDSDTHVDGD